LKRRRCHLAACSRRIVEMAKDKKMENNIGVWQPIETAPKDRAIHVWLRHVFVKPRRVGNVGEIAKNVTYHYDRWCGCDMEGMWEIETEIKGGCKIATHWMDIVTIEPPKGETMIYGSGSSSDVDDCIPF